MFCKASPLIKPPNRPAKGSPQSAIVASSKVRARRFKSLPVAPEASRAAITLPALLPTTISGRIPWASNALMTPTWANPRAAPAPSARPTIGFLLPIRLHELRPAVPRSPPMPIPNPNKRRRSGEVGPSIKGKAGFDEILCMWLLY